MLTYLGKRGLQWLPVLFISSIVVFFIVHLLPGDPAVALAGPDASPSVVDAVRHTLGLDRSLPVQYVEWLGRIFHGDFGQSYVYHLPASQLIFARLPASLILAVSALILALLFAVPVGVLAAYRQGGLLDRFVSILTSVMIATPNFWFGILVILLFAARLGWLPAGGYVSLAEDPAVAIQYLILPAAALALNGAATLARFTRSALLDVLNDDFIRTAKAKGAAPFRLVIRHGLRNSLVPMLTMVGIVFGHTIGGAVIIESVFAWPGVGRLLVQAIGSRDYAVIQGLLLILVLIFLLINLLVDMLYGVLDPRIRVDGRAS
jgi:ABC-type dipeptide/oligopeptide/nickel transport system permease component